MMHLAPRCALQVPVMKVGVPGKFHEDRWPRTAEDSERLVDPAHTGSGRDPSDTSYRVAKRSSDRPFGTATLPTDASVTSPRGKEGLLAGLRHGHPTHRYLRVILAWQRSHLSALRHGDLACRCLSAIPAWRRGSSGRSSARRPYPQVLQGHPRVAKGASGRSSARRPYPQVDQWHSRGATVSWCTG